jgi:hypothetical protein
MANALILPTFELVTECLPYDKVFAKFLRGGVKDVVRESIVGQTFYRRHQPLIDPSNNRSGLMASILHTFDEYCIQEWGDAHMEPGTSFMDEYLAQFAIIEFVVQEVEEGVENMLYHILRAQHMRTFDVDEFETQWRGRDLMVYLKSLNRIRS